MTPRELTQQLSELCLRDLTLRKEGAGTDSLLLALLGGMGGAAVGGTLGAASGIIPGATTGAIATHATNPDSITADDKVKNRGRTWRGTGRGAMAGAAISGGLGAAAGGLMGALSLGVPGALFNIARGETSNT